VAFDLTAACSGFLFALITAAQVIRGGSMDKVRVIGADRLNTRVHTLASHFLHAGRQFGHQAQVVAAIINACRPFHWRDQVPLANTPSPELARKARDKYGWLLESGTQD
jgi:acetyl-CoA acetyltransferase